MSAHRLVFLELDQILPAVLVGHKKKNLKKRVPKFGLLMTESHHSMRDDFKMSLPSIDNLVNDAIHLGAVGARLTGGGFGGCIVACILKENLESWRQKLLSLHPKAFNVI